MLFGIDVVIVAPGAVKTPIWSKAGESTSPSTGTRPISRRCRRSAASCSISTIGLPAEKIAEASSSPHLAAAEGALPDCAGPDAAPGDGDAAEAHGRRIIAKRLGLMPPAERAVIPPEAFALAAPRGGPASLPPGKPRPLRTKV